MIWEVVCEKEKNTINVGSLHQLNLFSAGHEYHILLYELFIIFLLHTPKLAADFHSNIGSHSSKLLFQIILRWLEKNKALFGMLTYWDKDVIDTFFGKIRQQFWNRILQWKKKLLAIMEDDFHRIIGSLEAPPYRQNWITFEVSYQLSYWIGIISIFKNLHANLYMDCWTWCTKSWFCRMLLFFCWRNHGKLRRIPWQAKEHLFTVRA